MSGPPEDGHSGFERWRRATLAPFEHRTFTLFWCAWLVSSFGGMIQTVGASWLMMTIAPSADQVALVQTAGALPFFFLSLIAGALADTRDRRTIMLASQVFTLLASIALAAMTLAGAVTPSLLLLLTFMIGCGTAVLAPAWQASIGDIVPRSQIAPAVMANAVGFNLARSLGPAIGGAIVAAVGAAVAFIVNAVSYLGIIAALLLWKPQHVRSDLPPEPLGAAIAGGLRYVSLSPHLLAILLRCALQSIPIAAVTALMPIVARDLLGGGAITYGVLLGGFGVGAMLGALGSAGLRRRFTSDTQLRALSALACVAMIAIGQSRWTALTLLAHVLAGSVWTLGFANFNIAVQLSSPRWVTGRMLATYQTIAFAGIALGSWWWGELASAQGVRESLTLAGLAALVSLAAARWLPVSVAPIGSLDPRARPELTPPGVPIHPCVGPDRRRDRVSRPAGACGGVRGGDQRARSSPPSQWSAWLVGEPGSRRDGSVDRTLREPDVDRPPALADAADRIRLRGPQAHRSADRRREGPRTPVRRTATGLRTHRHRYPGRIGA